MAVSMSASDGFLFAVNNAVAAIGQDGDIELRMTRDAEGIRLSVSDTGDGMDEAFVPHALDRFSRQSEARTSGGAGLGLSIVAGIATNAGGSVSLTNSPGTGLRVDVSFPMTAQARGRMQPPPAERSDRTSPSHR